MKLNTLRENNRYKLVSLLESRTALERLLDFKSNKNSEACFITNP